MFVNAQILETRPNVNWVTGIYKLLKVLFFKKFAKHWSKETYNSTILSKIALTKTTWGCSAGEVVYCLALN